MLAVIYLDLGTPELAIAGERFALIESNRRCGAKRGFRMGMAGWRFAPGLALSLSIVARPHKAGSYVPGELISLPLSGWIRNYPMLQKSKIELFRKSRES